jgi:predicted RNA-binding protein with PUA-like domain
MNYWIFKTEPAECSIDDLMNAESGVIWEGVRNYQARNFLRAACSGDLILIHHSSCAAVGIAGVAQVIEPAFSDPSQFNPASPYFDDKVSLANPRWSAVKVKGLERFTKVLSLQELRQQAALQQMQLLRKGNRLSVMPLTEDEYRLVYFLGKV